MSFNDIFKSSFLENVSEFSILDTVIGLAGIWCISLLFKDHPLDAGETHQQAG